MSLEERVAQSNRLWWQVGGGPKASFHDILDNITVEFLRQELDRQISREGEVADAQAA